MPSSAESRPAPGAADGRAANLPNGTGQPGGDGRAWMLLAALLGSTALFGEWLPATLLDWQPARAGSQPWRAFSAIAVHYSALHLGANLAGAVLVGALGWAAGLPARSALAWAAAWPLTQLGLLLQPALLHYGGLSGVLHAGVAVAGMHLLCCARGRRRAIGATLLTVLVVKLIGEAPWGVPLRFPAGWDIAVAPFAHASGAAAGLACAALAEGWHQAFGRRPEPVADNNNDDDGPGRPTPNRPPAS